VPIVSIIVALLIVGVALYLIQLIPLDSTIKQIIRVLVILLVVLWVISLLFPGLSLIKLR